MFSYVSVRQSVILSTRGEGESHVVITHDALDFTVQPWTPTAPLPAQPLGMGPHCTESHPRHGFSPYKDPRLLQVISGGHHWRPVQNCSLQDPPNPWCWHLVAIEACTVSASRQYASYWNAVLFLKIFRGHKCFLCDYCGPVLDFSWRLPWVSKPEWIPQLHALSPAHNAFLWFTSGATPADLLAVRMATESYRSTYLEKSRSQPN